MKTVLLSKLNLLHYGIKAKPGLREICLNYLGGALTSLNTAWLVYAMSRA